MAGAPKRPDLGRQLDDMDARLRRLERQTRLQSASIGSGGLVVRDQGSISIEGGGDLTLSGGDVVVAPPGSVHSSDFVAGSAGWSINGDGSAEFSEITLREGAVGFEPRTYGMQDFQEGPTGVLSVTIQRQSWASGESSVIVNGAIAGQSTTGTDTLFTATATVDGESTTAATGAEVSFANKVRLSTVPVVFHRTWNPPESFDVSIQAVISSGGPECFWGLQLSVLMLWRR